MSQAIDPRIWAAFGIIAMAHTATASPLTGRLGGRADLQSTAPVSVITAESIDQSGVTDLNQLAGTIPTIAAGGSQTGSSEFTLRGLGQNSSLVLINGRRAQASGSVDLRYVNTIPANLIERVEICKDASGATYGADAVAGVVSHIRSSGHTYGALSREVGSEFLNPGFTMKTDLSGTEYSVSGEFCVDAGASLPFTLGVSYTGYDLSGSDMLGYEPLPDGFGINGIGGQAGIYIPGTYPSTLTYGSYNVDRDGHEFSLDLTIPVTGTVHIPANASALGSGLGSKVSFSQFSYVGGVRFGTLNQDEHSSFETETPAYSPYTMSSIDYWTQYDGSYFGAFGGIKYSRTWIDVGQGDLTLSLAGTIGLNRHSFDVSERLDAYGLGGSLNLANNRDYEFTEFVPTARIAAGLDYTVGKWTFGGYLGLESGTVPKIDRFLPDSDVSGPRDPEYSLKSDFNKRIGFLVAYKF